MLLAKIRDVLLNRRNKVEIESLEGEVTVNGKPLSDNFSSIYEVQNIKAISEEILSKLKAGDVVQKVDSSGKHSYIVSFKKDGTGICLTYTDASIVETQSYDFTEGHWVYNSEDLSSVGGTKLYKHTINDLRSENYDDRYDAEVISLSSSPITSSTSWEDLETFLSSAIKIKATNDMIYFYDGVGFINGSPADDIDLAVTQDTNDIVTPL